MAMRTMKRLISTTALASLILSLSVPLAAALQIGDPAPRIAPGKWAQGAPVHEIDGDKVYIVEFWASWCGPCITAIPHLNDLSKKFSDDGLVVIGQNLGEDENKVADFIRKMGDKMSYRVAVDDAAQTMAQTWLRAAGQSGIPCAFVVNKLGRIAYIGHPMRLEEPFIRQLLAEPGTKSAAAEPEAPATLGDKATELAAQAQALLVAGKPDEAAPVIAALHDELPDEFRHLGGLLELDLMIARKQFGDAVGLAGFLAEDFSKRPDVMLGVAERLARAEDATSDMFTTAAGLAEPLANSEALAIRALVAFRQGESAQAVSLQQQAVDAAAPEQAAAARKVLDAYQQDRLP